MKIVIIGVAPPYRGGISLHNALLFNELSKRHDVICYNFIRQYPDFLFPGKTQYELGKSAVSIPSKRTLDSINPISWYNTANEISNLQLDLVILRSWNPFFSIMFKYIINRIKNKNNNVKFLVICDNIYPHEKIPMGDFFTTYLLKKMDAHLVQSKQTEMELNQILEN